MRLIESKNNENFYVEAKIKACGCSAWSCYFPVDSTDTIEESESIIKDMIRQNKELGDKDLWQFRIMKRIEKHYVVKTIVGKK